VRVDKGGRFYVQVPDEGSDDEADFLAIFEHDVRWIFGSATRRCSRADSSPSDVTTIRSGAYR